MKRYRLASHKRSTDGSGKCNILQTGSDTDAVFGAIYSMKPEHKQKLDKFEGLGKGYIDHQIELRFREQQYNCFTYQAQQSHIDEKIKPFHWYKRLVLLGAMYLKLPNAYTASIEAIESSDDPMEHRRIKNEELIERIISYC